MIERMETLTCLDSIIDACRRQCADRGSPVLTERIRDRRLRDRIVAPDAAAALVKSGMAIGTAGDSTRGFPSAVFLALAERARNGLVKDLTLVTSSLPEQMEGWLAEAGALKRRLGSYGNASLRKLINAGKVSCNDVRAETLSYMVRSGSLCKVDCAIVDAVAITEEGFIVPSHAPVDIASLMEAADQVIVEIDGSLPAELEGFYDHYLPPLTPPMTEIPLYGPGQRIGTPWIPIPNAKIKAIVVSDLEKKGSPPAPADGRSARLAGHLAGFFREEVRDGRLPPGLLPIEIGLGSIADGIMKSLATERFANLNVFSAVLGDGVLDLIEAGKCDAATGCALLVSDVGWDRLRRNTAKFRESIVLRPLEIVDHPETVRRLKLIAINGAIEVDIYGHVNSSHISGTHLVNGIGGSAVFAGNAYLSVFSLFSTGSGGDISTIVPMVTHVDHPEHCVDVVVTETGLADLRGLAPVERAGSIIEKCAHPDYRPLLRDYLERARRESGGHEPHVLDEAFSFHRRFRKTKTMRVP